MFFQEYQMRARYEELLREAEYYRLISQIKQRSPRRRKSLNLTLAWLGRCLRRWGDLLLERFGDTEKDTLPQDVKSSL